MRLIPVLSLSLLLVTGCTAFQSKPEKPLSFSFDNQWDTELTANGEISSPEELLNLLNAPELPLLFKHVEQTNFDLKIIAAQLDGAAAAAGIDASRLWPSLDATLQGSRTESDIVFRPESYSLEGALSWELDLWGRVRNQKKASALSLEAAIANYASARLSLAGNLANAWFGFLSAKEQLALGERNLGVSDLTLKATEKRYRRGLVSSLDLSQARSAFATANADLANNQSSLAIAKQTLMQVLGPVDITQPQFKETLNHETESLTLPTQLPEVPASLPIDVVRFRPDLIAAERNYRSAVQLWRAAGKQALPTLGISASAGFNSLTFEGLGDSSNKTTTYSGQLSLPIFNFGRIKQQTKQAEARAEEQFQTYNKTVFNALLEIQQNMDSDRLISDQLDAQNHVGKESKRALDIAYREYNDGLTNVNTVINAEQNYIASQRSLINLKTQRLQQRVSLLLALGGKIPHLENTLIAESE
jgi:NodT family efflux transporter outer membrane factor (OMF) lipoprotein